MPQVEQVSHAMLLFSVLQILITAVIVPGTFMLIRRLGATRDHLSALNGRIGKAETRIEQHEEIDPERLNARRAQAKQCRENFRRQFDAVRSRLKEQAEKGG